MLQGDDKPVTANYESLRGMFGGEREEVTDPMHDKIVQDLEAHVGK